MVSAAALVAGVAMLAPGTAQASQTSSECVTDQSSIVQCFHDWSLAWAVAGQTHSSINDVFTSAMADSVTNVKANAVNTLVGVQNLPHLRSLTVGFGNVYNLQPLAGLSELSDLTLRYNHVDNVAPLASDAGLKNIDMTGNNVHDVSPLAGLHGLQSLNLDRNHVDDLRPLSGLSNLSNASFSPESINRPDAASSDNVSLESAVAADGSHVTPTAMVPATGVYDPATGTVNWDHTDDSHKVSLQFKQNVRVGGANAAFSGNIERAVPAANDSHQNNQDHQNHQNQNHGNQNQNHGDQNQGHQNQNHGNQNQDHGNQNQDHGNQNHGNQNQNHGNQNQNHGNQNQDHQNHQGNHSNGSHPSVTRTYRVQFDSEHGSRVADQRVSAGQTASELQAPTRRGYTFVGWQYNHKTYDFSTPVTHDIQLRAQWKRN